jgi:hypothetical protein
VRVIRTYEKTAYSKPVFNPKIYILLFVWIININYSSQEMWKQLYNVNINVHTIEITVLISLDIPGWWSNITRYFKVLYYMLLPACKYNIKP